MQVCVNQLVTQFQKVSQAHIIISMIYIWLKSKSLLLFLIQYLYYYVTGGSTSQSVGKKYRANHPKYRSTQTSIATSTCERIYLFILFENIVFLKAVFGQNILLNYNILQAARTLQEVCIQTHTYYTHIHSPYIRHIPKPISIKKIIIISISEIQNQIIQLCKYLI